MNTSNLTPNQLVCRPLLIFSSILVFAIFLVSSRLQLSLTGAQIPSNIIGIIQVLFVSMGMTFFWISVIWPRYGAYLSLAFLAVSGLGFMLTVTSFATMEPWVLMLIRSFGLFSVVNLLIAIIPRFPKESDDL